MEATEKVLESQPTVFVRGSSTVLQFGNLLADLLPEAAIHAGDAMSGPPFVRYLSVDGDVWEIEAGVPVSRSMQPAGRVEAGELPGGLVVSTWHVGPYDQMQTTYEAIEGWLAEHQLREAGPPWEVYWSDPTEVEELGLRTEIVMPVERA